MATAPTPPEDVKLVSYADDCTVLSSGPVISEIETKTNSYLAVLLKWFQENSFELSPGKSSAPLFTTFSNESGRTLKIEVEGNRIPTEKHPKILGVTFDPMYRFGAHAKTVVDRVAKRNNVLCALAGSSWGKDKELLLTTYKATGRAIINYAAHVWSPGLADSHWQKIQRCQNSALRSATGCTGMTMEDNLHNERDHCQLLPVRDHCQLLSAQHLLASQSTHHPNHQGIKDSVSERDMRKTLTEKFGSDVESATGRSHPKWLKRGNIVLHSKFVRKSISNMRNNKVLNAPPPPISESEKLLRSTRVKLAQLRGGYSKLLNSYMSRIDPEVRDVCPDCQESPHDTKHLFQCKNKPTHLKIDSLWLMPVEAASFLGL